MFCDQGHFGIITKQKPTKMELLPHQKIGVEWLLNREQDPKIKGGLLCDEMGLGKTIQMIEVMKRNKKFHTLIVVPKSIVQQWKSEFEKFAPSFNVCVYDGPKRKFDPSCEAVICPYSVLVDLVNYRWDRVILDEGHEIRNPKSLVCKNAMLLRSSIKWIVTGTPVFNKMRDFIVLCGFVGVSRKQVQAYTDKTRETYILRRVKTDLTPIEFNNVELEMYDSERELYEEVYNNMSEYDCVLEWILRCRQVCSWPQTYYDGVHKKYGGELQKWKGSTAKIDTLVAMIKRHPDEKSLVFTQFTGESIEIQRRLGKNTFMLNGQTEDRENVIKAFKRAPSNAVFIIQIKAGGVGLNLQEATRVYITQPSWNPAIELQAIARSHRNGQTKKVTVKKLVYSQADSVDNEITELQTFKSKVCAQVLGDESLVTKIPSVKKTVSNFIIRIGKRHNEESDGNEEEYDP